jgi:RNA polymerase sigma factor (sigma-70 family)
MAPTDAELIDESFRDPDAFATLFDRHFALVFAYCVRRAGSSPSEDLAGEVFCRAFASRKRYDLARADAAPWLVGIAAHVVVDHLRTAARQSAAHERAVPHEHDTADLDSVVTALDARRDLANMSDRLARLPAEEVETLLLYVWEELTYEQIAVALAIPVGTVRSRLNRVRRRLRRLPMRPESGASRRPTPAQEESHE